MRKKESERRREAWKMATTSFLKMKCEIVPESSYRIIPSLSLPSVIEKAIYRACQKKLLGEKSMEATRRGEVMKKISIC